MFYSGKSVWEYLVSHARVDLWKTDRAQAKEFDNERQVSDCVKYWKIKYHQVEQVN
jgi:hypothetical protein